MFRGTFFVCWNSNRRGISNEQVCIVTAIDRNNNIIVEPVCTGRVGISELDKLFEGVLKKALFYVQIAINHTLDSLPNIKLANENYKPLLKYGKMRKSWLMEYHKPLFNHLLLSEKLVPHLNEVDDQAQALLDKMMPKYIEYFGITAELKRIDQMEWVRLMNMAHSICEDFIFDRIVYK